MSGCSENKTPLQRGGINQQQRFLAALQKDYVNVDERDYAGWIVFAAEFSKYIKFYDTTGAASGNWSVFFSNDISAILGVVAIQDIDAYRRAIKERFDFIKEEDNAAQLPLIKQKFDELFSAVLTLSKAIDGYYLKLPAESSLDNLQDKDAAKKNITLKTTIKNLVQLKLAPSLQRLIAYYKAASPALLQPGNFANWIILNKQVTEAAVILNGEGLTKELWNYQQADWAVYLTSIAADASILGLSADEYRKINHAANHNLFASVFDQFVMQYARIISEAEKELLKTLGNWDTHPPHYALFLSFLRLFRTAQSSLNTLTQRHLDFYYKEVLRLKPKDAEPNQAHILAELAKQVPAYALAEDTLMKAGKDSEGKEVLYSLDKEETFNKAKAVKFMSLYKGTAADAHPLSAEDSSLVNNEGRIFASPVANSADGIGAKLTSTNGEWHPFVNKIFAEAQLSDISMPNAQLGFAVASHYLFLSEGERKISVLFDAGTDNSKLEDIQADIYLTTEKEWYKVEATIFIQPGSMTTIGSCAQISFTLPGDAPAITPYDAAVHGATFNCNVPVLKVYLRNDDTETPVYNYNELKDIVITHAEVKVEVGTNSSLYNQDGLKQLQLANDFGPLDASKPFQPFGPLPSKGSSLIIGNEELFTKPNSSFRLNIEWKDIPAYGPDVDFDPSGAVANGRYPAVRLKYLSAGTWKDITGTDLDMITENASMVPYETNVFPAAFESLPADAVSDFENEYKSFDGSSRSGFVKIQLTRDFGHDEYQSALTTYLVEKANKTNTPVYPTEPVKPYTPVVQSLYLSYSAFSGAVNLSSTDENDFENRAVRLFQLHPFGEAEQHSYLSGNENNYLLPQFNHSEKDGINTIVVHNTAEFYVGMEDLSAEQSVNILFQVLEGSTDPLLEKPDEHVFWSYLANNQWIDFDAQMISDATRQLVQSGIISFIIPADATTDNTLLPSGYLWLRASVATAAEAVCKLLSVNAQAAVVTFNPNNNAADFLDSALPAGTISKLKTPEAAVKKITQPYSSFGGRAQESSDHFYVRVSESLRHKARAITIWDYEHLVLEAFPQIQKVKCLNHTKFEMNEETGLIEYNEVKPGYVCIITIPDLVNRNDTNPLRPYTNQNTLLEIEEYLSKKVSCHVKVRVRNPQFEEVRLSFFLKLMPGYDDFTFYSAKLKDEITRFLTPWAYSSAADIQFGGKIYKSTLINFIEERPYVDFITDVEMYQKIDETTVESGDLDEITASTAKSILVSAAASKHNIEPVTETDAASVDECSGSHVTNVSM